MPTIQDTAAQESSPTKGMNRVVFLLALSVFINYIDRSNLSIAVPLIKDELGLSDWQLGKLLAAFFWTYGFLQIPSGWLTDRFDVKWVFAVGFFLWSAATAATGILHGFAALILIRVILGMGESVAIPSCSKIVGTHFGENLRGSVNAFVLSGLVLGPSVGMLVGGTVVGRFGWRPFFLVLGLGGLLWLVPWLAWMPSRAAASASDHNVRIRDILRQRSAWGTCLGQFCFNYCLYFLVTWLPFYLVRGRHFSMDGMARIGGMVFLLSAICSTGGGKFSDHWIAVGASVTRVRKTLLGAGSAGLGVSLGAAAVAPDNLIVWALASVGIFLGITGGGCWTVTQTLAGPRVAGRWTGVQNFVGNFAGAVAPMLTGYLLNRTGRFYWPILIAAAISWLGALSWVFGVGSIEPVDWETRIGGSHFGVGDSSAAGMVRP